MKVYIHKYNSLVGKAYMFGKSKSRGNMFTVRKRFIPEPEPEPMVGGYEDEEVGQDEPEVIRPERSHQAKKRLPGEKLLRELHKARAREQLIARLEAMKIEQG